MTNGTEMRHGYNIDCKNKQVYIKQNDGSWYRSKKKYTFYGETDPKKEYDFYEMCARYY